MSQPRLHPGVGFPRKTGHLPAPFEGNVLMDTSSTGAFVTFKSFIPNLKESLWLYSLIPVNRPVTVVHVQLVSSYRAEPRHARWLCRGNNHTNKQSTVI